VARPKKKKCLQTLANFIMTVKVAVNVFDRSQVTAAYFVLMATPSVHQSRRGMAAAIECTDSGRDNAVSETKNYLKPSVSSQ
jgi:hypothetical protein